MSLSDYEFDFYFITIQFLLNNIVGASKNISGFISRAITFCV